MPHVDEGTLHALLDGALRAEEPERARRVEAHLETCADCRARLEQAAALRDQAAGILDRLEQTADTGDFQEVLARAARSAGADERTGDGEGTVGDASTPDDTTDGGRSVADLRRRYRWTRGLAWAATIVVALGAGYMVRDLVGPLGQDSARLMTRSAAPVEETAEDDLGTAAAAAGDEDTGPAAREAAGPAVAQRPRAESASSEEPTVQTAAVPVAAGEVDARKAARAAEEVEGAAAGMADDRVPEALERAQEADIATSLVPNEAAADLAEASFADAAMKATDAETAWVPAELAEAESRVGPILLLPDADVVETELAADGAPVARTLQRLPGGVEVRVVQMPGQALEAAARPAGISAAEPGAPAAAERHQVAAPAAPVVAEPEEAPDSSVMPDSTMVIRTVHLVRDGVLLTLSGPMAPEALRALAAAAAPRNR